MLRHSRIRPAFALAGLLAVTSPAWSQSPGAASAVQQILLPRIQTNATLEKYLESLRNDFFMVDADSDGQITQRDVELHTLMEGIQVRTQALNTVMRYDLDSDGFVTEEEIRRGMSYDLRVQLGIAAFNKLNKQQLAASDFAAKQIDNMVRTILALDSDKDGKVSVAEAAKLNATGRGQNGSAARARQFVAFDGGSRGALSLSEFQAAGEALFRQLDADKDGAISQQELADYRTRAERVGCEMPRASEKAKVVL